MIKLLYSRSFYIALSSLLILSVIVMAFRVSNSGGTPLVTTTVETGVVQELVSVSGVAEADQTAELAFPVTGIVETVHVARGDSVSRGDRIISLSSGALLADRQDALASLSTARANREELLAGPTDEAREVTAENVATAEETLATIIETENQKVANAYRTLLSSGLAAYSTDDEEEAVPPTISGTYGCEQEGTYQLDVFASDTSSGFSYRLSGLETGVYSGNANQPGDLGECGLQIQFEANQNYHRSQWVIEIPNVRSPLYVPNRNAHALAITQRDTAIRNAEQALNVATADSSNQNAPARSEALTRANASLLQAQARLTRIDATISDRILIAPFDGVITELDVLPGETVTTNPVVTLLASEAFEVTARIPEIDIGQLSVGQPVIMVFDAKDDEEIRGTIDFISLRATEIDGVAYYEATIELDEVPTWMRSGLNADIDIVVNELSGLRIPKRFVTETERGYEALVQTGNSTATTSIEVLLDGNDGFVSITGLSEGDVVVAP
jgi:RND family efflux transporter MFP subunit